MTFELTTLPSGLRVATKSMPHVESVSVGMWVDVGARHEDSEVNGISHMLEHMAFKGTARRTAQDIAVEFDAIGGASNAYTSMEHTVYYARVLKSDLPKALDIIADILQHSTFDAGELERERQVILQEIAMYKDTPDDVVFEHFQRTAYPKQPLGRSILGPAKQVAHYSRENLMEYMYAHYTTHRMILAAAGHVDHAALVRQAEGMFTRFNKGEDKPPVKAVYRGGEWRKLKKLEQLHLIMGFEGITYDDPDYYAIQMASTILGGGMSSRLFQEVREKRGLAYSIASFATCYADTGMFTIYSGTSEKDAPELIRVAADETLNIIHDVTEEELNRAKNQAKAGILMATDSPSSQFDSLGRGLLCFGKFRTAEELIGNIDRVQLGDISRVLRRVLKTPMTLAAMGPIKQVAEFGLIQERFAA